MRAALYLRVSTDEQDAANQEKQLRSFIEARSWEIVETYEDVASGADPARLAFNRMMKDARLRKWDVLVFWAWDRMTRKGIEATFSIMRQLQRAGVAWESLQEPFLSSATDTAVRDLILSIMSWVAEQERRRISERTKAGMARKKALGKHMGRPKGAKDKSPRNRKYRKKPVEVE